MKYLESPLILTAGRSPIGRLAGQFADLSALQLAEQVAAGILGPSVPAEKVEVTYLGQVLAAGTGMNLARQLSLRSGCPQSAPAYTVNMVCGSGLKAVALAAQEIASGEANLALCGGAESMSNAPHLARLRKPNKLGAVQMEDSVLCDGLTDPLHRIPMGETAELLAERYGVTREDQDQFALASQQRAVASAESFQREIVPITTRAGLVAKDEHPRADTTVESLARLKPAFRADGTVTAGNASGINDGAALLTLGNQKVAEELGLKPRARIVASAAVGCDPLLMGIGPVGAIQQVCREAGWALDDVDSVEINEAFAAQTVACARELKVDPKRLNRRGGAIALGHPVGASGARVLVTLLHILEDRNAKKGIAALCVGGGMGIAIAIERD